MCVLQTKSFFKTKVHDLTLLFGKMLSQHT